MSNELLQIAEGLHLMSEGVRSLAEQGICSCKAQSELVENTVVSEDGRGIQVTQETQGESQIEEEAGQPQTAEITIEEVRAVMADKSQDGKTQQVKALLKKYGAEKLSGVQPEQYKALLADAKAL